MLPKMLVKIVISTSNIARDNVALHLQELAEQVRHMEDEAAHTEPSGDLGVLHVALREVVDACDNKASQLYALQHI